MERIQGIVLEIRGRRAIILTPDGDFKEVPAFRPDWEVGQTVELPAREPISLRASSPSGKAPRGARKWARYSRWVAVATAAAVMLAAFLSFGIGGFNGPQPVFAAVTLDAHDTFRFYVDVDQHVLSASASSQAGMELLAELEYQGRPLDEVVESVLRQAVASGQLDPGQADQVVLLSATVVGEEKGDPDSARGKPRDALKKELEQASSRGRAKLQARDVEAPVAVLTVAAGNLDDLASELGLTVNQYLVLLKARELGLDLSLQDMRGRRYVAMLRKQGISFDELLASIQAEGDFDELVGKHHEGLVYEGKGGRKAGSG